MTFKSNGNYFECDLSSDGRKIFDMRAPKRGSLSRDTKMQRCFLAQDGNLVAAPIPAQGICETAIMPLDASVKVYPGHPMSDDWLAIKPSRHPIMTQHYSGHMAALGQGYVMESGIRAYEGHTFTNGGKDGELHVIYGDMGDITRRFFVSTLPILPGVNSFSYIVHYTPYLKNCGLYF